MSTDTPPPPPPPPDLVGPPPVSRVGRFRSEVMAGGAVDETSDDELVGGWRGALGVAAVAGLFVALAFVDIWFLVFAVLILWAIFMHELGHFMTARWTGMKATQFFIGFGPRLWSFRRGETEYGLRALPLGAFVRIIGMNRMDDVDPADEQRTYRVKSYPRRMLVISAGSIMHMLIAISMLFIVYVADGEQIERAGAAVAVPSAGSELSTVTGGALAAGVQPGDVIVAVDGRPIEASTDLAKAVRDYKPGDEIDLTVLRGGAVEPQAETLDLNATLTPSFDATDEILAVEDSEIVNDADIAEALAGYDADEVVAVALAAGTSSSGEQLARWSSATVQQSTDGDPYLAPTALLGVTSRANIETVHHSVPAAAVNSVTDIVPLGWEMTTGIVKVINPVNVVDHLTGSNTDLTTRPTTLVGVGAITNDVGNSQGIVGVLYMMAVLNIFIGIFNMFPLLPLDGGHAAIATYERIRESMRGTRQRYYADVERLMPFAMMVVLFLGFLFASGLYLDIADPL